MKPTKEMKKLTDIANSRKLNFDNVFYMGMPLSKMDKDQLKMCLAHSIGLNLAYGAIDKDGKANLTKK